MQTKLDNKQPVIIGAKTPKNKERINKKIITLLIIQIKTNKSNLTISIAVHPPH